MDPLPGHLAKTKISLMQGYNQKDNNSASFVVGNEPDTELLDGRGSWKERNHQVRRDVSGESLLTGQDVANRSR